MSGYWEKLRREDEKVIEEDREYRVSDNLSPLDRELEAKRMAERDGDVLFCISDWHEPFLFCYVSRFRIKVLKEGKIIRRVKIKNRRRL